MPEESLTPPPYDPRRRVGTGLAGETTQNEGNTIRHDASQHPVEVIGDFEVFGKLGQGGMGAVYRARQVSLERQVALKILPANFEADAEYVSRFEREARVAASLSHANLVKVYVAGVADGCHYIAMELIEGETLGQWVKRTALPPLESLRIILDVARALEYGWRTAQLIHRDIKPGNIFLSVDGEVKLGDLGLAKIIGSDTTGLTQTGTAMGTPHYISPEQARGDRDIDFRADIYSLGCTLYQMLTRRTPYGGTDPMAVMSLHRDGPPPAILKVMPQCPVPLARLVSKMLKKQRRERPASYEELIAALESVRAQLDPSLAAPSIPAPSPAEPVAPVTAGAGQAALPPAPAKSRMAVHGGAGVLVLAVAAFFLWPREEKLTKAQLYAREHAGEQRAGGESTPPAPVESGASATPAAARLSSSAEPWQDVLHDPAKLSLSGGAVRTLDGLRFTDAGGAMRGPRSPKRDGAVRLLATFGGARVQLRARDNVAAGVYQLYASDEKVIVLGRYDHVAKHNTILREFPLRAPFQPGQDYEFELRVVGQTLTAMLNGEVLGTVTDGTFLEGEFGVGVAAHNAAPTLVKALEVLDLDAPGGAVLPVQPPAATFPQPPKWIDATAAMRTRYLASGDLVADGEWWKATRDVTTHISGSPSLRNPILRVLFSERVSLAVRRASKDGHDIYYNATIFQGYANISIANSKSGLAKGKLDSLDRLAGEHEAVFAAQGDALTLWLDGKVVATAKDSTLPTGSIALGFVKDDGRIKKVEYGELPDTTPAAVHLSPSTEPWQDVLRDPAQIGLAGGAERTQEGLRFTVNSWAMRGLSQGPQHDGAVRMRATFGGLRLQLNARHSNDTGSYRLYAFSDKVVALGRYDKNPKRWTTLRDFSLREPLQSGQDYELELRVVGQTLTAKLNGEILGAVTDATFTEGRFGVQATDDKAAPALVKTLEVLDLDAIGGTNTVPAPTIKNKPL